MLFSEYCINVYEKILENSNTSKEGGLDIHVSHDLFIIALRKGLFNNNYKFNWISFLGGFAFSLDKNQDSLLDIEKTSIEPIQILNKKSIPVFKIKHIGGEKNGKKK